MITLGIDAHKRTHTVVAVDEVGRQLATKTTTATTSADHLDMIRWADQFGPDRTWAVEDCRHLSRRLEADLLGAGERIKRVPPKLMANTRNSARTYGKSDPIDALAVARAALANPDLPTAQLDGPSREVRLLVDHRDDLVAERTRCLNRLRWHLHELDPTWDPPARSLTSLRNLDAIATRLATFEGPVARIAAEITAHARHLTMRERALERDITNIVSRLAPTLLLLAGVGALTAAKIIAETADIRRFKSKDAFARHNGTAPLPVWSGNTQRHRLSRTGNRQLNAAIHRIAITQARCHPDARAYLERRTTEHHNTKTEALRALKRRLSDIVYRALLADAQPATNTNTNTQEPLPTAA
jgi:transposase